jgi:hypothetical protein
MLNKYPWSGHSDIIGTVPRDWQNSEAVLSYFSADFEEARRQYEVFVENGIAMGRRPELVGGGLVRSLGDWSQVLSSRQKGDAVSSDARILGSGDFVDRIVAEAEVKEIMTLRLKARKNELPALLTKISRAEGIEAAAVRTGGRRRGVARVRKIVSQIAVRKLGYSGAEVARFLGVSTSAVNRLANQEELPDVGRYVCNV